MIRDGSRHFSDFGGVTYLNCAAQGPLPNVTVRAIEDAVSLKTRPFTIDDALYFQLPDRARSALGALVNAAPETITLGNGATHGMAVAALGFPWQAGDEVVVAVNDFPTNVYLWTQAARRNGGKRILVKGARHAATTDEILNSITPRTRIVSVSLVDFGSGEIIDLARLGPVCRDRGIFLAVDATQAVGVMPVDAAAPGVSLLTSACYKWLLGPYGGGFACLAPDWADRIEPSYLTWTAAEGAENFNALPREDFRWVSTARRYDGPEVASFLNTTGMARSAEFIAEIGRDAIHAHVTGLLAHLEANLPAPFRRRASPSPVPGPILMIEADDAGAVHAAYKRLRAEKIWVSLRDDGIRVSPHIYNTQEDMDRLLGLLASG